MTYTINSKGIVTLKTKRNNIVMTKPVLVKKEIKERPTFLEELCFGKKCN